jgi:hypothetical protein
VGDSLCLARITRLGNQTLEGSRTRDDYRVKKVFQVKANSPLKLSGEFFVNREKLVSILDKRKSNLTSRSLIARIILLNYSAKRKKMNDETVPSPSGREKRPYQDK